MGALIGAGAGLLSSGLALGAASAQRGWEERMANTQYQRGVADMRKAGLNPALMFGSGSPAPTPNVPMAPLGDAVSSALQAARLGADIHLVNSQAAKASTEAAVSAQDLKDAAGRSPGDPGYTGFTLQQMLREGMISSYRANASSAASLAELNKAALPGARVTGSKMGGWLKLLSPIGQGVSSAARVAEAF